jgi:transposase
LCRCPAWVKTNQTHRRWYLHVPITTKDQENFKKNMDD